jgi:hypothetical protein
MDDTPEKKRPTCHFCGRPLSREDARISGGKCCFDCALTYMGGAAHKMAEGIRAEKREQESQKAEGGA